MKVVDAEKVRQVVDMQYAARIEAEYGVVGTQRLRALALALDQIFQQLAYEMVREGLTVLVALDEDERLLPSTRSVEIPLHELPAIVHGQATIQVLGDERLLVLPEADDPCSYAEKAIVYHFATRDHFVLNGALEPFVNYTNFPSVFGTPTFFKLDEALQHYKLNLALYSQCSILATCWHDEQRWLLKNKPEDTMQVSLHRYLRDTLRGHQHVETRREQPVGGHRPPDIKITWSQSNSIAYIEVKWMGASVHRDGTRVSTSYDHRDAIKGAAQLVGYLDENQVEAASHQTFGYLVVFDARRNGLTFDTTTLPKTDALYFQARDVPYDPDFRAIRHDFAKPWRFFMAPVRSRAA